MTDEEIQETVTKQEEKEKEEEIPCQCIGPSAQEAIQNLDNIITWLPQEADADPSTSSTSRLSDDSHTLQSHHYLPTDRHQDHVHSSSPQTVSTSNSPPP